MIGSAKTTPSPAENGSTMAVSSFAHVTENAGDSPDTANSTAGFRIIGLQLSHNAVAGQDDPNILKELYDELDFGWKE